MNETLVYYCFPITAKTHVHFCKVSVDILRTIAAAQSSSSVILSFWLVSGSGDSSSLISAVTSRSLRWPQRYGHQLSVVSDRWTEKAFTFVVYGRSVHLTNHDWLKHLFSWKISSAASKSCRKSFMKISWTAFWSISTLRLQELTETWLS